MKKWIQATLSISILLLGIRPYDAWAKNHPMRKTVDTSEVQTLEHQIKRFARAPLTADISKLSPGDAAALTKVIEAARCLQPIYLDQVWSGNLGLWETLKKDKSPLGKLRLEYFLLNAGPWSLLDDNRVFIPGAPAQKPPGAHFYPLGLTKDEFQNWTRSLSAPEREKAVGFFTVIRREEGKKLKAVPYSEVYHDSLSKASALLQEAAKLTTDGSLKKFLGLRAQAFLSNDYYESDVAWMDLDAPLEVTIGPYEVYQDELFNYKASFEAVIGVRDDQETAKLAKLGNELQDIENHLPIDALHRNPKLGALAPIRVVDEVFTAGDARHGVAMMAYNLPNDERVTREKGSKRVLLNNVQKAKFEHILVPIAKRVLTPESVAQVGFDPFFTHVLMHELMHGLGPHDIQLNGKATTARQALKELHSPIEEAKADISGLWALQFLIDKGVLDRKLEKSMYTTFLASCFRSVRFGVNEAHGRGVALQFNYLTDAGAFRQDERTGKFSVDFSKVKAAVAHLTHDLMMLEALGNYDGAKAMLEKLGLIRPPMQKALDHLNGIPVDINATFPQANET